MAGLVLALGLLLAHGAAAHPGRTDSRGGHTCRTNCESYGFRYGEYHLHRARPYPASRRTPPPPTRDSAATAVGPSEDGGGFGTLVAFGALVASLVLWPLLMVGSAKRRGAADAEAWWSSHQGVLAGGSLLVGAILGVACFDATSSGLAAVIWSVSGFVLVVVGSFAGVAAVVAIPWGLARLLTGQRDAGED